MSTTTSSHLPVYPKWMRDILQLLPIRAQFVLSGQIRDDVLIGGAPLRLVSVSQVIREALSAQGFKGMLLWDVVEGLQADPATMSDKDSLAQLSRIVGCDLSRPEPMNTASLADLILRITNPNGVNRNLDEARSFPIALVVDFASRLEQDQRLFTAAEKAALEATVLPPAIPGGRPMFNPVFWLVNRPNDLPDWFTVDNERVRTISIGMPDADTRRQLATHKYESIARDLRDVSAETFSDSLTRLSHNMTLNAISDIVTLARRMKHPASQIDEAVECFRIGDTNMVSPWRGAQLRKAIGEGESQLPSRVKGQDRAVTKVLDILKRTSIGLTGAQSAQIGTRPRGVLFFAGPTGVGKTEMAKAIAELVFGDQNAYRRWDMSEFSADHSDARLIGAPPSYVGFDQGGELTNAMREQPFRVLLFDEIEKAAHRILDKFLQVLEDGRLTDGRGETVFFTDALIIFTSNAGVTRRRPDGEIEWLVRANDAPEEMESKVIHGVKDYFENDLRRPELLNRIGENIVVFNFISPSVGKEIMDGMLKNIVCRVADEHRVQLVISPDVYRRLEKICLADLTFGGRGIGSKLEAAFINPLARLLFKANPPANKPFTISGFNQTNGIFSLECNP